VIGGKTVALEEVNWIRHGDCSAIDPCQNAIDIARNANLFYVKAHT
jgi:hypothetical protein